MIGLFRGIRQGLALLALASFLALPMAGRADPLIAAAANVQPVLEAILAAYQEKTGQTLRVSYASTGNLVRQIRQGAPFEVFLSADTATVMGLEADGLTDGPHVDYALGRLALVVPRDGIFAADADFADLRGAVSAGRVTRFAIANPAHAPYGARAAEALRHAGLWADIEPRLVLGENVAQATQFVASGNADGGIVALSLAMTPAVASRLDYVAVPAEWHEPLVQGMALLPDASDGARAFFVFLQGPEAKAILAAQGYDIPVGG